MIDIPLSYILTNLHFVIATITFFAFFATAWLFFDSWLAVRRSWILLGKAASFFILSLWAIIDGALITSGTTQPGIVSLVLLLGIAGVTLSFLADRLPGRPQNMAAGWAWPLLAISPRLVSILTVILGFVVTARMWQQATTYLEKSRRLMALALGLFSVSWLTVAVQQWPGITQGALSLWASPFGLLWSLEHGLELIASLILLLWAWRFMRFRLFPQLYLTVVAVTLLIFVVATVLFTMVLLQRTQAQTLQGLETNARVFSFTLEELKQQLRLTGSVLSSRTEVVEAVATNDQAGLLQALGNPIKDFGIGAVTVINGGGEVVHTIGGTMRRGESLSGNEVVKRAFKGEIVATAVSQPGPEFPTVLMQSVAPLVKDKTVVGAVIIDFPIDAVFLDRVKALTHLETALYGGSELAVTTIRDSKGRSRLASTVEDDVVTQAVISDGTTFLGNSRLGYEPFLVAGLPLLNVEKQPIGVVVVGLPQTVLVSSLEAAVRVTLIGSLILMLLSLFPLYGVARLLSRYQSA